MWRCVWRGVEGSGGIRVEGCEGEGGYDECVERREVVWVFS